MREPSLLHHSAPHREQVLTAWTLPPRKFHVSQIRCRTATVPMRDGIRLAADIYSPPLEPSHLVFGIISDGPRLATGVGSNQGNQS